MIILKLLVVFIAVMLLVSRKQPIYVAVTVGAAATWLLYGIPVMDGVNAIVKACTSWSTLQLIVVMYIITFLQKMMGARGAIDRAQKGLSSLFNNRWVNCAAAPIFIGMLPTPNAAFIAGDIVKASADGYMSHDEMAVTTTYFRHVSESFMPTYAAIIMAISLAEITAGEFVVGMLPIVACIIASGCFWFLRGKVPMATGEAASTDKARDAKEIFIGLWPILAVILMVVVFKMQIYVAAAIILVLYALVNRFPVSELIPFFKSSLQFKLYLNTFAVMILKEFLTASGAINALPDFFAKLPIPSFMVFMLIFFFGSIVSGSTTIIGLCMTVAMATVPNAGLPLVCLLMGTTYAAMQMSPTHICLTLTAEYFDISLGTLIKKTLPAVATTVVFSVIYYLAWTTLLG
ncbi:MAG: DUF401 family protein [Oscillospiraceae bacterium]|nr:DUF401 family protein [Oscillospiraceae bacterium]